MRKNAERAAFSGANGFSVYCSIHRVDDVKGRAGFQGRVIGRVGEPSLGPRGAFLMACVWVSLELHY